MYRSRENNLIKNGQQICFVISLKKIHKCPLYHKRKIQFISYLGNVTHWHDDTALHIPRRAKFKKFRPIQV